MNAKILTIVALTGFITGLKCLAQNNLAGEHTYSASYATNHPDDFKLNARGEFVWNGKSIDVFWRDHVWMENSNGWRVTLRAYTNLSGTVSVGLGRVVTNSGGVSFTNGNYLTAPYHKFSKFELLSPTGKIIQARPDAGTNLFKWYPQNLLVQTNLPAWASPTNGALVVNFPETATVEDYPHFKSGGSMVGDVWVQAEPTEIIRFELNEMYSITNAGDYTLTVRPVLYQYQYGAGDKSMKTVLGTSYSEILHRVDLPSVTTKVHLVPISR